MTAYSAALGFHSYWRWVVLSLAALSIGRAGRGWVTAASWSNSDDRLSKWLVGVVDLQVLVGLVMYFVWSPFSRAVFHDFRAAMKDPTTRFFGLEHASTMLLAFVVIHVGKVRLQRLDGNRRHRAWAITLGIWLLLVAAAFPWPWTAHGRPWLRLGF